MPEYCSRASRMETTLPRDLAIFSPLKLTKPLWDPIADKGLPGKGLRLGNFIFVVGER